jgi:hypothetical protein
MNELQPKERLFSPGIWEGCGTAIGIACLMLAGVIIAAGLGFPIGLYVGFEAARIITQTAQLAIYIGAAGLLLNGLSEATRIDA